MKDHSQNKQAKPKFNKQAEPEALDIQVLSDEDLEHIVVDPEGSENAPSAIAGGKVGGGGVGSAATGGSCLTAAKTCS